MASATIPDRTEASEYYFTYIDQVGEHEDICDLLESQGREAIALFRGVSDEQSLHRYAPGKWSIREVVGHIIDGERVFALRALWFARGDEGPLPGFEQDDFVRTAGFDQRTLPDLLDELRIVRASTIALFRGLPPEALTREGIASGHRLVVRAVPFLIAGHELHHRALLLERYLGAIAM